uniref:Uncharacterized protein n=1 Tax=Arundo donax TaxID=35708 RepID=A0A0A8YE73_ARUDO
MFSLGSKWKLIEIQPDSELFLRLITLSSGHLDREAGNVPWNPLEARFKNSSLLRPSNTSGMEPVNPL